MIKKFSFLALASAVVLIPFASADPLYGVYHITASFTCTNPPSCTQGNDLLSGSGSNSLQGPSTLIGTGVEDTLSHPGVLTTFTITSTSNGDEVFGVATSSIDFSVVPELRATGTVVFTGGTGQYVGFSDSENVLATGIFTSNTTAEYTLVFAPEPGTWAELSVASSVLLGFWHWRRRQGVSVTCSDPDDSTHIVHKS